MDEAAKANTITLEEFLEVERHKLGSKLTPVNKETFAKWKRTRMDKKEAEQETVRKSKDARFAAGKSSGMSGRDLFSYNPEWFEQEDGDEEEDWDISQYRHHATQDEFDEIAEEGSDGSETGIEDLTIKDSTDPDDPGK